MPAVPCRRQRDPKRSRSPRPAPDRNDRDRVGHLRSSRRACRKRRFPFPQRQKPRPPAADLVPIPVRVGVAPVSALPGNRVKTRAFLLFEHRVGRGAVHAFAIRFQKRIHLHRRAGEYRHGKMGHSLPPAFFCLGTARWVSAVSLYPEGIASRKTRRGIEAGYTIRPCAARARAAAAW